MKQHLSFTFTAALASAAVNVALVYSFAILFSFSAITLKKLILLFLLHFVITIAAPRFFIVAWFKDYLKHCRSKSIMPVKPVYFWMQLGLFYLLLLVCLFQLVALLTNNIVSESFGLFMDQLFSSGFSPTEAEESFAAQSFFVQNFFFCFIGFLISLAIAGRLYKNMVDRASFSA